MSMYWNLEKKRTIEFQCEDCMYWSPQDGCYLAKDPGEYACTFFVLKASIKQSRFKQPTLERWI